MSTNYTRNIIFVVLAVSSLLSGCATMDQAECTSANWYDLGVDDGEKGRKSNRYSDYQKDCNAFGVSVDTEAYGDGWEMGIHNYCTRDNGYGVGVRGTIYQHSCPAELEDAFFNAYQMGRAIHLKTSRINILTNSIQAAGDDLAKTDLTEEQRKSTATRRKQLKRDLEVARIGLSLAKFEARKYGFAASY